MALIGIVLSEIIDSWPLGILCITMYTHLGLLGQVSVRSSDRKNADLQVSKNEDLVYLTSQIL